MDKFRSNHYSSHGHFRVELIVIPLVFALAVLFVFPHAKSAYFKIKQNSAIDGASLYKESVDNFFISKLLLDSSFKLDGTYVISSGNLVSGDDVYRIPIGGNVPDGGYLNYSDNSLVKGCINIDGYSVMIVDGKINAFRGDCGTSSDVALGF